MSDFFTAKSGDGGNDSNSGATVSSPKLTIGAGLALLGAGDRLYVRRGTYVEGDLNPISGSSDSARTVIAAYPGDIVTIQTQIHQFIFRCRGTSYITVNGFIIDGGTSSAIKTDDNFGGDFWAHHIRISNNEIKNSGGNGVLLGSSNSIPNGGYNEILNNIIHDNATVDFSPYGHGIYITCRNNIVDGNHIYNNDTGNFSFGAHSYNSGVGGLHNNIFRNNRIHGHHKGGGLLVSFGDDQQVYNNLLYDNIGGLSLYLGSNRTKVFNNTIVSNTTYGVQINGVSAGDIRNNIIYQNGTNIDQVTGDYTQDHNLIGIDPRFVDAANGDFRLIAGSPAIDAALNLSQYFTTDFYGNARS